MFPRRISHYGNVYVDEEDPPVTNDFALPQLRKRIYAPSSPPPTTCITVISVLHMAEAIVFAGFMGVLLALPSTVDVYHLLPLICIVAWHSAHLMGTHDYVMNEMLSVAIDIVVIVRLAWQNGLPHPFQLALLTLLAVLTALSFITLAYILYRRCSVMSSSSVHLHPHNKYQV